LQTAPCSEDIHDHLVTNAASFSLMTQFILQEVSWLVPSQSLVPHLAAVKIEIYIACNMDQPPLHRPPPRQTKSICRDLKHLPGLQVHAIPKLFRPAASRTQHHNQPSCKPTLATKPNQCLATTPPAPPVPGQTALTSACPTLHIYRCCRCRQELREEHFNACHHDWDPCPALEVKKYYKSTNRQCGACDDRDGEEELNRILEREQENGSH
jgi:hypothetical protein